VQRKETIRVSASTGVQWTAAFQIIRLPAVIKLGCLAADQFDDWMKPQDMANRLER
jgi:hypothetical protein